MPMPTFWTGIRIFVLKIQDLLTIFTTFSGWILEEPFWNVSLLLLYILASDKIQFHYIRLHKPPFHCLRESVFSGFQNGIKDKVLDSTQSHVGDNFSSISYHPVCAMNISLDFKER